MTEKTDKNVHIWGLSLFGSSKSELLTQIQNSRRNSRKPLVIMTPNPEQVVRSREDAQFLKDLQSADIQIADGAGLGWATRFLAWSGRLPGAIMERITGADLTADLLRWAGQNDLKVLILGGREYQTGHWQTYMQLSPVSEPVVVDPATDTWQLAAQPIMYWTPGYADAMHPTPAEENQVRQTIKRLRPQVLFVAFGAPAQERWAAAHRDWCQKQGVELIMVVGGAFDYHLGLVRRAPQWARHLGLEWLFRLVLQPWRWRRQLKLIQFLVLVMRG